MALIKEVHYTYRDVTILPGNKSLIEHRAECNPFNPDGMLPLFTAPMDTVVSTATYFVLKKYKDHNVIMEEGHGDDERLPIMA